MELAIGKTMPVDQADVWFGMLDDLTPEQMRQGFDAAIKAHKFGGFPPIGTIRELALGGGDQVVTLDQRAVLAWDLVVDKIRTLGGYASVHFDDPAISATIRTICGAGVWIGLCDTASDELHRFIRPRFVEAYKAHAKGGVNPHQAAPLVGLVDQSNGANGYDVLPPANVPCNLPGPPPKRLGDHSTNTGQPARIPSSAASSVRLKSTDETKPVRPKLTFFSPAEVEVLSPELQAQRDERARQVELLRKRG